MAPGLVSPVPGNLSSSFYSERPGNSRHASAFSTHFDSDTFSQNGRSSRRESGLVHRNMSGVGGSNLTSLVHSLYQRSGNELGAHASSRLMNSSYESLKEWIRVQRMSHLPPEGSNYDKVLSWALLFIERLHHFDSNINKFAGDSYLATQLSYGYCGMLLDLGKENAEALMTSFGFFYSTSSSLVNLLERTELFDVSQEIKEQLILALADLVTLVSSVSTHFHQAISGLTKASVSVHIYDTFPGQILAFRERCSKIAEAMWRHQLVRENIGAERVSVVRDVRSWLAPEDRVLAHLAENTSHLAHEREEMTCLWVSQHLTNFLKSQNRTLAITGKPGSGKTVTASVIIDRLQDPIAGVSYKTLYIPINARVPAETTPIAIAKTILYQLFEKRIGNTALLQIMGEAYERSKKTVDAAQYENILWTALERALNAALQNAKELVIVVDGVDEATGGEAPLLQKLLSATTHATGVKLITLGAEKPKAAEGLAHLPITEDRIGDDVSTVVRASFEEHQTFLDLPEMEQEIIIDQITEGSQGSFLWAKLCSKRVRQEKTPEALHKAVETVVSSKVTVTDFVLNTIQSPDVKDETRQILLWLATADRPFTLKELTLLSAIDVTKQTITDGIVKPLDFLRPVNSLVFVQDGQVYLRHGLIRTSILDIQSKGKLVPSVKDRHADFVTRLFIYMKNVLPEQHEPSLTPLDGHDTTSFVQRNPFLDFCVRYWPRHLTQTTVYTTGGDAPTAKEFSKIFPATITLLLLQNTLWHTIITPTLVTYQTIVTNLCRNILSPKHAVTLQSIITLAFLRRDINLITESIPLFYEITILSRDLLTTKHLVTMKIANIFLELTSSQTTTSRTDVMIKREEILLLVVECYKIHYGNSSEQVVNVLKTLIEHYRMTKEEKKIQEITTIITTITTGYEAGDGSRGDLHVHLKGHKQEENESGILFILDAEEDESVDESFDYEALIALAEKYRAEGKIMEAERIYVEIWQRANRECRIQTTSFWEEIKLKAVVAYSKFLKTEKRESEASSILSSVWEEHRHTSLALSEQSSHHYEEIATVMASVGLSAAALSIYKQVAHYFQSTSQTKSSRFEQIQKSISSTSEQVIKSSQSSHSSVSESTMEEIIYESFSSHKFDESSFTATSTLIAQFTAQHRWKDATRVIKKVLQGLWPTLFAPSIEDVVLPAQSTDKAIELAERLSRCYHYRRRFAREENIRIRVYRAVRAGRPVDDKVRERVTEDLIRFFERNSQPDNVIATRQETLDDYIKHYGRDHPVVIKTLWTLAELTRPRPIFVEYYQRIIRALNKDAPTCKPEALEPLILVATELWTQSRYSDAVAYFTLLFTTFLSQPKQPRFENPSFVQEIFTRYIHCLRSVRTDYNVIHKVTVDYQSKVKTVFTATASITIQATLTLAKVCQESKRYESDAIALYVELLKLGSKELDLDEISATLDGIYEEQAQIGIHSESASKQQIETASKILRKRVTSIRESHGWAHEESISKMKEIVEFNYKHSSAESVHKELKESTINILKESTSSTLLVSAAIAIASSYISTNQVHKATEMSEELYRQVVMKDTTNIKNSQFDLTSKGRQSLVFLAQLEHSLRQQTTSITEILASLTTEYVYFEEFRSVTSSKTASFHSVSLSATRLYHFLRRANRQVAATHVFNEYVAYFVATEGKRTKVTDAAQVKIFLTVLLDHFQNHQSSNFVRSVGIASNLHVIKLLESKQYDDASNLALAAFYYISAHDVFRTAEIVKFVFTLGVFITGRTITPQPDAATQKKLHSVSSTIIQKVLGVISDLKINLSQISLDYLNILIGLLGEQQDYKTLVWLLSGLWASRNKQVTWPAQVTLSLARRFILARYLVGDSLKAVRLTEDIVYNCRRVNGPLHSSTLELSTLLTQLYTGIAQRYQTAKNGQSMANKYYKKAAAVHENLLRIYIDPALAEMEGGLDNSFSHDGSAYELNIEETASGSGLSEGEHVRQHLHLLKLAVQRLGDWPKEYAEYEALNAQLFAEFGSDLKGFEGVEKWNLKGFGSGKSSANDDVLNLETISWEIDLNQPTYSEEEEEL
ncbi:uncharacterized protein N7484_000320 [Penicillium longicatenatum]|uniref:uncharacterized protein n=1 Tax=Penicillium longicatenatum TaxID=1561947 RepID=UPI002547DCA8|nr:uncharacterized protein N7484_000320 [Penicillium longicatenatum]KAJ5660948.1 hypothetical protein N7484_000320 [Penicillium longicatenatum]